MPKCVAYICFTCDPGSQKPRNPASVISLNPLLVAALAKWVKTWHQSSNAPRSNLHSFGGSPIPPFCRILAQCNGPPELGIRCRSFDRSYIGNRYAILYAPEDIITEILACWRPKHCFFHCNSLDARMNMRRRGSGAMRCFASIVIALYVHLSIATFFPGAFHSAANSNRLNRWHKRLGLGFQGFQLKVSNSRNFQRQIVMDIHSLSWKRCFHALCILSYLISTWQIPFFAAATLDTWGRLDASRTLFPPTDRSAQRRGDSAAPFRALKTFAKRTYLKLRDLPKSIKKSYIASLFKRIFLNLQWGIPERRMSPVSAAVVLSGRENDAVRVKHRIQTNTSNAISFCFSRLFSHWKPTWDHIDLSAHLTLLKCWHGQSLETSCSQESIWPTMKMYQSRNMPALICRQLNSGKRGKRDDVHFGSLRELFSLEPDAFCWRFYLFVVTFDEVVISRHWHPPCTSCWRRSISIWSCPGSVKPVDSVRLSNSCPSRMYETGGDHPTWEPSLHC